MTFTTHWTGAAADGNLWDTDGNWDNSIPLQGSQGFIAGSDTIHVAGGMYGEGLDFTGYTGQIVDPGGLGFSMYSDLVLSAGMTFDTTGTPYGIPGEQVTFVASGSLTSAGQALWRVVGQAFDGFTLTLADDLTVLWSLDLGETTGVLDMSGKTLTLAPTSAFDGWDTEAPIIAPHITKNAGSKIVFDGGTYAGVMVPYMFPGMAWPAFEVHSGSVLPFYYDDVVATLALDSLSVSNGYFGLNSAHHGGHINLAVVGDMDLTGGILGDPSLSTIAVGGDLTVAGVNLSGGTWNVVGAAVASACAITGCDFSGGTTLTASGCVDGGGNTNVDFVSGSDTTAGFFALAGA